MELICPFYYIISEAEIFGVSLNIYRIINLFNINIVNDLEIIYIGQSLKSTLDRLKDHNKWGEIFSSDRLSPEVNSYLVYTFNFDQADTLVSYINGTPIILNIDSEIEKKIIVDNLEIAFISYYKPILNKDFKNTNFSKTDFIIKKLPIPWVYKFNN